MTRQGQSDERQRQEAPGVAHADLKYQILREARQTGTPVSQVCAKHQTPAHTAGDMTHGDTRGHENMTAIFY